MFQDFLRKNSFLAFICNFQDDPQKFYENFHFPLHIFDFIFSFFIYIFQSIYLLTFIKLRFFFAQLKQEQSKKSRGTLIDRD